jgi:hypothetical protein
VLFAQQFSVDTILKAVSSNPWEWGWDAWVAIGTIFLGVATVVLAVVTVWTSWLARRDTQLQHQQLLSPVLGVDRCILTEKTALDPFTRAPSTSLHMSSVVRNLGGGPGMNNFAVLTLPNNEQGLQQSVCILPNVGGGTESSVRPEFFSDAVIGLGVQAWNWEGATVTFRSMSMFDIQVTVEYEFIRMKPPDDPFDQQAADILADGWSVYFEPMKFDIKQFNQNKPRIKPPQTNEEA